MRSVQGVYETAANFCLSLFLGRIASEFHRAAGKKRNFSLWSECNNFHEKEQQRLSSWPLPRRHNTTNTTYVSYQYVYTIILYLCVLSSWKEQAALRKLYRRLEILPTRRWSKGASRRWIQKRILSRRLSMMWQLARVSRIIGVKRYTSFDEVESNIWQTFRHAVRESQSAEWTWREKKTFRCRWT